MKLDDSLNGLLAVILGLAMIIASRGMTQIAHIEYGPGFFPSIAGGGLMLAGLFLIIRRIAFQGGAVEGLVQLRGQGIRGAFGFLLIVSVVGAYILFINAVGFLLLTPILLFVLIYWFERRANLAAAIAVFGTLIFHIFFYQLMSAPLPWGVLKNWSGALTW